MTEACIEWDGPKNDWGYGKVSINHKSFYAHRVSYANANGLQIEDLKGLVKLADYLEMPAASPADQEVEDERDFRVGLFWSSADPHKQVKVLADGAEEIARHEKHHSFIRWIAMSATPPAAE